MLKNREDYIKSIYELGGETNKVSTKDIAKALNISPPSVSEMIKKLVKEDFIEYTLYKGVKLTEFGVEEALRIKKRHILWEVFLVEKLGYNWEDVNEEAELLEHVTSSKLEKRLEEYLDYPKNCPHGTPLSHPNYLFDFISLDKILEGEEVFIKRIEDDKEVLRYMKNAGLNLEDKIKIIDKNLEDKFKIEKDGEIVEIEKEFVNKIYVK